MKRSDALNFSRLPTRLKEFSRVAVYVIDHALKITIRADMARPEWMRKQITLMFVPDIKVHTVGGHEFQHESADAALVGFF